MYTMFGNSWKKIKDKGRDKLLTGIVLPFATKVLGQIRKLLHPWRLRQKEKDTLLRQNRRVQ